MPSQASTNFESLVGYVDQLIDIHGQLQAGPGRRHGQDALHRAGVVLTVAAWEGYVESVIREAFTVIAPAGGATPGVLLMHQHMTTLANADIKSFNTPNAQNVRRLFEETIGFDPRPHWVWATAQKAWTPHDVDTRMDEWLKVRHGVAHGAGLPQIPLIAGPAGQHRLTLGHLEQCRGFFKRVVERTDDAFRAYVVAQFGVANPWPA